MANSLFQNMNRLNQNGAEPKNTVSSVKETKEEEKKKTVQPRKRMKRGKYKRLPKDVEFPTNLKISNRQRNSLRVIALQGHAKNQKDSINYLIDLYVQGLNRADKKMYKTLLKSLNDNDTERYKEEHK